MSLRLITDDLSREQKLKLVYAAWMRADEAGVASMFTEDCEFQLMGNPVLNSQAGLRIGRAGVLEVMRHSHRLFHIREFLIEKIIVDGDDAVVHWHSSLEIRPTRRVIDSERCDLVSFRDGLIHTMKCFYDTASMAIATGRARPAVDPLASVARKREA